MVPTFLDQLSTTNPITHQSISLVYGVDCLQELVSNIIHSVIRLILMPDAQIEKGLLVAFHYLLLS